jgi:hypothetical protein
MPHDLAKFGVRETLACSLGVRRIASKQDTLEAAARNICRYLYEELRGADGEPACAMVRCYKTHRFRALPPELQRSAKRAMRLGDRPADAMPCLTLMATSGDEPAWNDRRQSRGHQAIPLDSLESVQRAPMVSALFHEIGVDVSEIIRPVPAHVRTPIGKSFRVFHVEQAAGSPYVPAQEEFVERYGIRSVVGFGGVLPDGEMFAVILFARIHIPVEAADRFRTISLDVKGCFLPFSDAEVFDDVASPSA